MACNAKSAAERGILLEAGTNEVEILVIRVGDCVVGVNVAKVREVLEIDQVTHVPEGHDAVEGVVHIRGRVVELVNLGRFLDGDAPATRPRPGDKMLVMEFCEQLVAFRVHAVDQIFRTSWKSVQPVPMVGECRAPVTSVVLWRDKLVLMLDFESIGAAVGMTAADFGREQGKLRDKPDAASHSPVIFAEDSRLIAAMLSDALHEAGISNLQGFSNGQEAWDHLVKLAAGETADTIRTRVAAIITDIEMPQMDGLTLTRKLREHPVLKEAPVVVFSSIVSKDNAKKGEQVGANAQIAKAQYAELAAKVLELINEPALAGAALC